MPANLRSSYPADLVHFHCVCGYQWQGQPVRVEPAPGRGHPYAYFAQCMMCDAEAPQVAWEIGMMSRWAKASGPKTEEGKARSAANLDGHPTPEETMRTRFNALKHGLFARQAKFFPAKPGKYSHCKTCDIDHFTCSQQPACLKRTELFMKHHLAFEMQDPDMLMEIQADLQAGVSAVLEDMLLAIIADGVTINEPQGGYDKEGGFTLARYVDPESGEKVTLTELRAHPLLKIFGEYLSRNNLSLADLNMTPKVKLDQEVQLGYLQQGEESKESMLEHRTKQTELLGQLRDQVMRSRARVDRDPVLLEHQDGDAAERGE